MRNAKPRLPGWMFIGLLTLAAILAIPIGGILAAMLHRGVMWGEERYVSVGEPPARLAQGVDTSFLVIGWLVSFAAIVAVLYLLWRLRSRRDV